MDESKKLYKATLRAGAISCLVLALAMIIGFWTYRYSLKNAVANDVPQNQIESFFEKTLIEQAMLKKLPYITTVVTTINKDNRKIFIGDNVYRLTRITRSRQGRNMRRTV